MTRRDDHGMVHIDNGQPIIFAEPSHDPRWEWIDVREYSDPGPRYLRGSCRHTEVVPVESVSGETVAHLCTTCDTQLPEELRP